MAGVSTFSVTRDDVIQAGLRNLGALGAGETPTTDDFTNCSQALNIMVKSWAKKGLPLWVTQELLIPLVAGVGQYPLGPTAGYLQAVAVTGAGTGYTAGTWLAVGGTAGVNATGTYTVSSGQVTSMTVVNPGDSYTQAPTSYTLSGAGAGATFSGTVAGVTVARPLKLLDGTFVRNSAGNDTTLLQISRKGYDTLGTKSSAGTPNQFYYDVQIPNGQLFLSLVPNDATQVIHAQIQRQFFDVVAGSDLFDFPQEWFQALKWGLSAELAAEYGTGKDMIPYYEAKARAFAEECFGFSVEEASTYFTVDTRGGRV